MAKKQILVAVHEIPGGSKSEPFTLRAGEVLDPAAQKKLGLSSKELDGLVDRGALVAEDVYTAPPANLPLGQTAPGTTGTEFEGMSIDAMRSFLEEAGISFPKDANGPDLMKIALEHQRPGGAGDAADIEARMSVKDIKTELDSLQVPYETDANKAALAASLAQARASRAGTQG